MHLWRIASLTISCHHVRDLNHGIEMCLWEDALATGTFNIEAEDPKRCECGPFTLRCVRDKRVPPV